MVKHKKTIDDYICTQRFDPDGNDPLDDPEFTKQIAAICMDSDIRGTGRAAAIEAFTKDPSLTGFRYENYYFRNGTVYEIVSNTPTADGRTKLHARKVDTYEHPAPPPPPPPKEPIYTFYV